MSREQFLALLQSLLTMVDPNSEASKLCVKNTLENVFALAKDSGKTDPMTIRIMIMAKRNLEYLIRERDHFAGKPGDYLGNKSKRFQLMHAIMPGC